ncbi:hypothetical protein K8F61_17070 [Microbacterium resistens]|uniref:Uncharacterized protein n=1 Tax=Microbacterium resistens TaxID=156977 RepID=A0ABY3RQW7_9MICO|nr:hypothetical protein [Microbacterium resistens]UGS26316.1 hypothetical protein K8F61_17070 [Microbacterium resistens]
MRLTARIPADQGKVRRLTLRLLYEGTPDSDGIDVTDVQIQPGDPSGVTIHPSDVVIRRGGPQWRNGVVTRTTDEVIILSNADLATPTRVTVTPARPGAVRVGPFRFGRLIGPAYVDGETGRAPFGHGRAPLITERSDGHVAVTTDQPVHMTVGWSERS